MGFRFRRRVLFSRQLRAVGPLKRLWWRRQASRHGRRDGKLGEPQDTYSRIVGERDVFKQRGDATLRKIKGAWQKDDALWRAHVLGWDGIRADRIDRAVDFERPLVEAQAIVDDRAAELEERVQAERSRGVAERWHMAQWVYWLAIPCIFAGEIFINAFAFDVLGAVPQEMKYAVAATISLAVVICSHAVGMLLKTGDITSRERIVLKSAFWFPILLLVGLSALRVIAFKQLATGTDIGFTLDGAAASEGSGGSQRNALIESVVFAMINIVMFVAACVLSFFAHDAHHDAVRRAKGGLRRARFGRWMAMRRMKRSRKRVRKAISAVNSGIAHAEGDFAAASTASRQYKDFFEELDAKYQGSNLRARARQRADHEGRARDRRLAELRGRGGEQSPPELLYDASKALLLKAELVDEMSKEKQPTWHKKMWILTAPAPAPASENELHQDVDPSTNGRTKGSGSRRPTSPGIVARQAPPVKDSVTA